MNYDFCMDNLIRVDDPKDWAARLSFTVQSLVMTARLALDNDGSGLCSDNERMAVAADTLEVVSALMAIVEDGADQMETSGGYGRYRKPNATGCIDG
ncbi:MAG: hypothetical protein MEQ74_10585 [Paracoccus sp.]|nr:hypothetical protein [Paracoccus sp. (in: a-proteobacteria)]